MEAVESLPGYFWRMHGFVAVVKPCLDYQGRQSGVDAFKCDSHCGLEMLSWMCTRSPEDPGDQPQWTDGEFAWAIEGCSWAEQCCDGPAHWIRVPVDNGEQNTCDSFSYAVALCY